MSLQHETKVAGQAQTKQQRPQQQQQQQTTTTRPRIVRRPHRQQSRQEQQSSGSDSKSSATATTTGKGTTHIPHDGNWKYLSDKFRKTRLCFHNFIYGYCKWGAACLFVHEPRVSIYQNNGTLCDFGDRCTFFQQFPLCMKIHPKQKSAHKRETAENESGCVTPLAPGGPMMGFSSLTADSVMQVCEVKGDMQVMHTSHGDIQYLGERGSDTSFVFARWPVQLERLDRSTFASSMHQVMSKFAAVTLETIKSTEAIADSKNGAIVTDASEAAPPVEGQ
jgi:hypothetical protein